MYSPRDPVCAEDVIRQVEQDQELIRRMSENLSIARLRRLMKWMLQRNRV